MPELPEVETIRRCLAGELPGLVIGRVRIKKGSRLLRDTVSEARLKRKLTGRRVEGVGRRGKYLIVALDNGSFLVAHLGMTGCLYTLPKSEKSPAHAHLRFELDDRDLVLSDPRTFGRVLYAGPGGLASLPALEKLGPEPLDDDFSAEELALALATRKAPIKAALLDQSVVAGLGNIYADEACFIARVNPLKAARDLTPKQVKALHQAIREVLTASIAKKGTTFRDYRWAAGRQGDFVASLAVYGKEGQPCPRCKIGLNKKTVAGRSTHFCPRCQI